MVRERIPTQSVEASTPSIVEGTSHSSSRLKSLHYHEAPPHQGIPRGQALSLVGVCMSSLIILYKTLYTELETILHNLA